ncbi:MAG: two-component system sensor histidine kinase CreC [Candidatus Methylacidiphilales bacterium]|nr:two-component system sensor histidine kinase CreC [Candidatus Methylacidiphilales bacterium]
MKIRTVVFLAYALVFGLAFAFLLRWVIDGLRPRYLEAVEECLVDTSVLAAEWLAGEARPDGTLPTEVLAGTFARLKNRRFEACIYDLVKTRVDLDFTVTDRNGIVLFDSGDSSRIGQDFGNRWRDIRLTLKGTYGARTTRLVENDPTTSVLHVAAPIRLKGELIGVVSAYKPSDNADQFIAGAAWKITQAGFLATAVVVLTSLLLSFWISAPIEKLTAYARAVRDGAKPPRPRLGSAREIRALGQAFEEMRDTLEGKNYIENYIQSLTHELKSPITSIRGAAELMGEDMEPGRRQKFAENIRSEAARMAQIVDRLLELASVESRKSLGPTHPLDLVEILRDVLASVPGLQGLVIDAPLPDTLALRGERFLLRQALENLLINAIEFSPSGGRIRVDAQRDSKHVVVRIEDEGPGIPDYAQEKIFERFFSLPRPGTQKKSSGLGLPFVKLVAELHGGTVTVANRPGGGGTRAELTLPT